jgi:hypothetical protein
MKTALLIGCGSKFGLNFQKVLLENEWTVNSISGTFIDKLDGLSNQLIVDWRKFTIADLELFLKNQPTIDLIFFNQNSSALSSNSFNAGNYPKLELWKQEKSWAQAYFTSCILPFHVIHSLHNKLTAETKVAWMLSSFVYNHSDINHADYIGNKYQNYLIMKNFSMCFPGCFFGINPDSLDKTNTADNIKILLRTINQPVENLNGKVVFFDGTNDKGFNMFNLEGNTIS